MSDFDWPEPVRIKPEDLVDDVQPHDEARWWLNGGYARIREEQEKTARESDLVGRAAHRVDVAAHRAHGAAGDPRCPMCVFTEDGFLTGNCRSCTRPIVWAVTDDGKSMPVDASEDPAGNVVLSRDGHGAVRVTVLDQASLFDDGTRRTSHFVTCPDADTWRSRRVGSR